MPYFVTGLPYLVVILYSMVKAILLIYSIFTVSFVYAEEETACEKKWNDHYDNKTDSEPASDDSIIDDSLVKFMLIQDCENDYESMVKRVREMREYAVDAYAAGDYETAAENFTILADLMDDTSHTFLAMMYENGEHFKQDFTVAEEHYRTASDLGNSIAQYNLGHMYHRGENAKMVKDDKEALKFWKLAAEQGDAKAMVNIGLKYEDEQSALYNPKESVKWLQLAAKNNESHGQFLLAYRYHFGVGVVKDYQQALKLYQLSAAQGNLRAQHNLGVMYGNGEGVDEDPVIAYMWFNIAVINGHQHSENARVAAKNDLTDKQFKQAEELSHLCIKNNYKNCGRFTI